MRVTFAGVGEAFDETLPNTSLLVEHAGNSLLLDCGLTAAAAFWRVASDPLGLDGVVISHFHGDHFLGLSGLLLRFVEEGRDKDFFVIGQAGVEARVNALMDMAYPGFMAKRRFGLNCLESGPGASLSVAGFDLAFALGDHSLPSLGVLVRAGGKSVYYSGDGRPTEATLALAQGADLVVHEAFRLEPDVPGHGTVDGALEFANKARAKALALVHVQRNVRAGQKQAILDRLAEETGLPAFLPEPGAEYEV